MRLLNVDTFALQEFAEGACPPYAILSHRWQADECKFGDIEDLELAKHRKGFHKILGSCEFAKRDGLSFVFSWYSNSTVCYVYLYDVVSAFPDNTALAAPTSWVDALDTSDWFTRAWTLQDLLAPRRVSFFDVKWDFVGCLDGMIDGVAGITGIPRDVLNHTRPLGEVTRVEDVAYSLVGILGVQMSLLYGEGSKAFQRLQEEVIKVSSDQTIFVWEEPAGTVESRGLLAPSVRCFANGGRLRRRNGPAYQLSDKGLKIEILTLQWRPHQASPYFTLGVLDLAYEDSPGERPALLMSQRSLNLHEDNSVPEYYVSGLQLGTGSDKQYTRYVSVSPIMLANAVRKLIYISRAP
ncbi:hypothetical protein LTS10_009554 [Elasticomyces elasticus]|nr:hypothetical protein LTS10_009554 [Elasticomyces elasticus]